MKKVWLISGSLLVLMACNNDTNSSATEQDTLVIDTPLVPAPDTTSFNLPDSFQAN